MEFREFSEFNVMDIGNEVTMVGGLWGGKGELFICLFPESNYAADDVDVRVMKMSADEWKVLIKQADLVETEALERAEDGKIYKAVVRKCQRTIDAKVSWNVFRRDGYRCRYCGRDNVPLTVDHLILWEEGGPAIEENLVAADRRCNKTRGNTQYADWLMHPYYKRVSRNLTDEQRSVNRKLVETLDAIPRFVGKRKKR